MALLAVGNAEGEEFGFGGIMYEIRSRVIPRDRPQSLRDLLAGTG
jgi:hypothetical protein